MPPVASDVAYASRPIDLPRLIEMAKEGVNNIKDEKQKQDQEGEKGTQECEV